MLAAQLPRAPSATIPSPRMESVHLQLTGALTDYSPLDGPPETTGTHSSRREAKLDVLSRAITYGAFDDATSDALDAGGDSMPAHEQCTALLCSAGACHTECSTEASNPVRCSSSALRAPEEHDSHSGARPLAEIRGSRGYLWHRLDQRSMTHSWPRARNSASRS
jgi:hypothetical protein